MRRTRSLAGLATALVATIWLGGAPAAQTFTIVGLPDTQNYSQSFPQIYALQTQWVANNIASLDIRYVSHYGDLVQNGDTIAEWSVADRAHATLDATGIPNGVTPGNHDVTPTGIPGQRYIPQNYLRYFGPQRYAAQPWFRGASPSGMSSYQVFHAGGIQFLTLHVECDAPLRELEWAQSIVQANRDKPVLFTTHRYLQDAEDYTGPVPVVRSGRYPDIWYQVEGFYVPGGTMSNDIFDWFVRRNPNIVLVQCGHFHEEFRQTDWNVNDKRVYEILADYQDDPNGGDGWLRLMKFDLARNRIDVDSYSPYLNRFRSAAESKFTLNVDVRDYFNATDRTVVLQQGINGYAGTQDTWLDEDRPGTSFGNSGVIVIDDDTTNSWFSDKRGQGLVRFDGLVGGPGVGQVPPGATIVSAHLSLQVSDDIDNPLYDPDFYLHRMLRSWSETSTWNSLGGGIGGSEIGPRLATIPGDNDPNADGLRRIDVTSTVQDWVNGQANHGFAILPEIINGNDDGIEMVSSEGSNKLLRPTLEIVYRTDCGYRVYGTAASPANTMALAGLGLPRAGGSIEVITTQSPTPTVLTAVSLASDDVFLFGGKLLIDQTRLILAVPVRGTLSIPLPQIGTLAGLEVYLQSFANDANAPGGLAMSNGLRIKVCQ